MSLSTSLALFPLYLCYLDRIDTCFSMMVIFISDVLKRVLLIFETYVEVSNLELGVLGLFVHKLIG